MGHGSYIGENYNTAGQALPRRTNDILPEARVSGHATNTTTKEGDTLATVPEVPEISGDTRVGLTTFVDQVPMRQGTDRLEHSLKSFALEDKIHTLESFLSRPLPLPSLEWNQTQAEGSVITQWEVPDFIFDTLQTATNPHKFKIQQFQFLKASVTLRIALNAYQFLQGRLLLVFDPLVNMRGGRLSTGLTYYSGLPHVEIDPNNNRPMELTVDMNAPYSHWNTGAGWYDMGIFRLVVLSPLRGSVSSHIVSITPSFYLSNVELSLPTDSPMDTAPENAISPGTQPPDPSDNILAQAGEMTQEANPDPEEHQARTEGVISGPVSGIAMVARGLDKMLGPFIPLVSQVTYHVAWISDWVAGAARFFGFNKPSSYKAVTPIINYAGVHLGHMDGTAPAVRLAAAEDNKFPALQGLFGTMNDEMHIPYVVTKYNYVTSLAISTSTPEGIIGYIPVMPGLCADRQGGDGNFNLFQPTQLAYVSSMFRFWSGTLKYRFSLVSTNFHAGRLLLSYTPVNSSFEPIGTQSFGRLMNTWSVLWDLSERNEVEMSIPYLSQNPVTSVHLDDGPLSYWYATEQAEINENMTSERASEMLVNILNGHIAVSVVGPLVAPETVSPEVNILLWVAAGDDFELHQPDCNVYIPVFPQASGDATDTYVYPIPTDPTPPPIVAQSGVAQTSAFYTGEPSGPTVALAGRDREQAPPLFQVTKKNSSDVAAQIAGERILSLRQIIKREGRCAVADVGAGRSMVINPAYFDTYAVDTDLGQVSVLPLLSYVAGLYAGYRGSQRFTISTDAPASEIEIQRSPGLITGRDPGRHAIRSTFLRESGEPWLRLGRTNRMVTVDVPQASRFPWRVLGAPTNQATGTRSKAPLNEYVPLIIGSRRVEQDTPVAVSRGAGDDFTFGILVGAPQVRKIQTNLTCRVAGAQMSR